MGDKIYTNTYFYENGHSGSYVIDGHQYDVPVSTRPNPDGSVDEFNSEGTLIRHYDLADCWFW